MIPPADSGPDTTPDPLLDLVVEALRHLEQGGESAFAAFCGGLPEQRTQIIARVDSLRHIGLLNDSESSSREFPERIGDFELRKRLGSGGMGVVYLAWQASLQREVALKLVRPEYLYFPGTRQRFRREIEAVARLRHEGIVQLYSVGEDQGVPWFAMERIVGADLSAVLLHLRGRPAQDLTGADMCAAVHELAGLPAPDPRDSSPRLFEGSWVRTCSRIAERVAQALGHAHAQGVLHRDLKPSNVMLTPDGRAVLMDFGLASTGTGIQITRSDAMLGSLQYMAPEQIGKGSGAVDERCDVYALGVTLYELLTLQPAFAADTSEALMARIAAGNPPRLKLRNPAVSWDAETVCLTACDRDPARRYPSASACARDLRNFLDLRPIEACRPSAPLRLARWAQRHPAVAGGLAVMLMVLVVLPILLLGQEHSARTRLQVAYDAQRVQWERAQRNVGLAASAVDQMLRRVAEEQIAEIPDLKQMCSALLDDASAFLDQLLVHNEEDPELRLNQAEIMVHAAAVRRQMLDMERAKQLYERALALVEAQPVDADDRRGAILVHAQMGVAGVARQLADAAGVALSQRALLSAQTRAAARPDDLAARRQLVECLRNNSSLATSQRDHARALALAKQATALAEAVAEASRSSRDVLQLVDALGSEHNAVAARGDESVTAEVGQRILAVLAKALSESPVDAELSEQSAKWQALLGKRALDHGDPAGGESLLRSAVLLCEDLSHRFPGRIEFRSDSAYHRGFLARALARAGRSDEAVFVLQRAILSLQQVVDTWPRVIHERIRLARLLVDLMALHDRVGASALADALVPQARALVEQLAAIAPQRAVAHQARGLCLEAIARHLVRTGVLSDAVRLVDEALVCHETARALGPAERITTTYPTDCFLLRAEIHLREGEQAAAIKVLRDLGKRLPANVLDQVPSLRALQTLPEVSELLRRGS